MKLPASAYNKLTIIGGIISIASLLLIIILFVASTFIVEGSPYLGIFNFMVLPGILVFGLILIPLGMYLTVRSSRLRKEEISTRRLVIDLNDRKGLKVWRINATIEMLSANAQTVIEGVVQKGFKKYPKPAKKKKK